MSGANGRRRVKRQHPFPINRLPLLFWKHLQNNDDFVNLHRKHRIHRMTTRCRFVIQAIAFLFSLSARTQQLYCHRNGFCFRFEMFIRPLDGMRDKKMLVSFCYSVGCLICMLRQYCWRGREMNGWMSNASIFDRIAFEFEWNVGDVSYWSLTIVAAGGQFEED